MPDRSQIASAIAKCIEEKNQELKFNTLPSPQRNYTELRATRYYSECFRLKENGTIEFYVYLSRLDEKAGKEVQNALQDCKDDYRKKAEQVQASCEWNQNPKGDSSFKLVGYSLDEMNWKDWESFSEDQRDRVSACYRTLADICRDSQADIGTLTVRRTQNRDRSGRQTSKDSQSDETSTSTEKADGSMNHELDRNLIYFGAPGTGKSHELNRNVEELFQKRHERVTFYPTYSYAQFVGCYKPVMKPTEGGQEEIAYEFVPGPFLRVLVNALKEPSKENGNWCLVIEEINRANAAAVFGDVFQLLDRATKDSAKDCVHQGEGESKYEVTASEDVKKFLQEEFKGCPRPEEGDSEEAKQRNPLFFLKVVFKKDNEGKETKDWGSCRLRIPSNMCIWATMNSADQGVFPMDTAFKRRWEFKYVDIDNGEDSCSGWKVEWKGNGYEWNNLRKFVNGILALHRVNEDKLMGTHFVSPTNDPPTISEKSFKAKVLMYLWEDAARMCRRQMFGNIGTYSDLLTEWDKKGIKIFENDEEFKKLKDENKTKQIFVELVKSLDNSTNPVSEGQREGQTNSADTTSLGFAE